ncbi:hypothetical protein BN1195_02873 [Chryseobacterium oranimense G311]|uniref:hypothetical protein n=1 Tax=Chryseobacterium oranimense TaxID=421058 RepID=UPI000533779C|nr:hypothetical protein [Chryseobacterium oranimense]CEJ70546.1 hypothetical protein BN1195_02873 [Chryseobacterium oranimense G311]DAG72834.1 MAG TPA: hypothetical protein [Caudoviricetes sp.]
MKKIHKKRSYNHWVNENKKNTLKSQRHIHDATQFQKWFAKMGGIIEDEDMEKVIEKFKQ